MAVKQASWIQASSHPADTDRLILETLFQTQGVVGSGDLAVTQNGTPNMSINVAAGSVVIDGTESGTQGFYHMVNDATLNVAIAAANATNPRIDLIVAKIQDAQYSGATNAGSIVAVTGTPAASPSPPAAPANSVILAQVAVAANATSITNANITDFRTRARDRQGEGGQLGYAQVTANQGSITAVTDITGLSVTVTVPANRRIRIHVSGHLGSTVAGDEMDLLVREGSTSLQERVTTANTANRIEGMDSIVILTPSAGPHTYKASASRSVGTGTVTFQAGATFPGFILVEDIGPA